MHKLTQSYSLIFAFIIPILLITSLLALTNSVYFASNPKSLSTAVILDLLLTVPVIYYLLIRKKNIPKTTVIPLFILGMLIGYSIIPIEYQSPLDFVKRWIVPIIEFAVLSFLGYKIFKATKLFKEQKSKSEDFFTVIKNTCNEVFDSKIAIFFATEIAVFYYGFFNWKRRKLNKNEFSYHKNTGSTTLLITVLFIISIETVVLHILLAKWNLLVAWIVTGLSIYTLMQILAIAKSLAKRPIVISNNKVYLRYGILNESIINIDNIESIELSTKEIESNNKISKLSPLANVEGHNIIFHLKKENTLSRFYGFKKKYQKIAFFVDEKEVFKNKLEILCDT